MTIDSESSIRALELDRLITEFFERQRLGTAPSPDEYIAEHPEHEHALRAVLPGASLLDQLGKRAEDASEPVRRSGDRLGEYKLLGILGRGGMGIVYEAVQEPLGRSVALKVLPASRVVDRKSRERFMREAQAAASLQHPSIVPVYGVGEAEGQVYYAMQRIDGVPLDVLSAAARGDSPSSESSVMIERASTLAARMRVGVLGGAARASDAEARAPRSSDTLQTNDSSSTVVGRPWIRNAVKIALLAAEAVSYAHSRGVLHRDIKPSNVMLDEGGRVYLTDFGLCKTNDNSSLTAAGDVVGTLRYVPPERFQGRDDARGDVYGIGMILYELLCGRPAFPQSDRAELVHAVTLSEPPRPRRLRADLPADLEGIVLKAIAKLPEERYASAERLIADLAAFLDGRPIVARAPGKLYIARLFVRRNRALVLTGALALVAIALASTFYVVSLRRLVRELDSTNAVVTRAFYHAEITNAANLVTSGREHLARPYLETVPLEARDWVWRNLAARVEAPALVSGEGGSAVIAGSLAGDGSTVALLRDESVTVYDAFTGAERARIVGTDGSDLALLPGTSGVLLVEGPDRRPRVLLPEGAASNAVLEGYAAALDELALSDVEDVDAEGRFVALASIDGRVVVLDEASPREPRVFQGPAGQGARIALFGPEGAVVRSMRGARSAIYGPARDRVRSFADVQRENARAIDGAPNAPVFYLIASSGRMQRFVDDGGERPLAPDEVVAVDSGTHLVACSPDGQGFVQLTPRGLTRLWTRPLGLAPRSSRASTSEATFLVWPDEGDGLIVAGQSGEWRRVPLPDYELGAPGISRARAALRQGSALAYDRGSQHYALAEIDGAWSIWSESRRLPLHARTDQLVRVKDIALEGDADGPLALALVGDGLRVWRRTTPDELPEPLTVALPEPLPGTLPDGVERGALVGCGFVGERPGRSLLVLSAAGEVLRVDDNADGWRARQVARLPGRVTCLAFLGTTGTVFVGLDDRSVWRVTSDRRGDRAERCAVFEALPAALAVDQQRDGRVLVAVTDDQNLHRLDLSASAPVLRWSEPCAAEGEALLYSIEIAVDEASGWIVVGGPDGRLRIRALEDGRQGPSLLDVYSHFAGIVFPRPGEPPVALERAGRVDHLESDGVDRSSGAPGVVPTPAEKAALERLSPVGRLEELERQLAREDLSLDEAKALRETAQGIRAFSGFNPRIVPPERAAAAVALLEQRIDEASGAIGP